jgi:hypothetical protein
MRPPDLDRGGSLSAVRPPQSGRAAGGGTAVLRLCIAGNHPLPELRSVELCPAPAEHLRSARTRRRLRVALPALLFIGREIEGRWTDRRREPASPVGSVPAWLLCAVMRCSFAATPLTTDRSADALVFRPIQRTPARLCISATVACLSDPFGARAVRPLGGAGGCDGFAGAHSATAGRTSRPRRPRMEPPREPLAGLQGLTAQGLPFGTRVRRFVSRCELRPSAGRGPLTVRRRSHGRPCAFRR